MSAQLAIDFTARPITVRDRLIVLAQELAEKAGRPGIILGDVRLVGVQRGILTGFEQGKILAELDFGSLMKDAGLKRPGEYRRSVIEKSHGNLHAVWVHPMYFDERKMAG